MHFGGTMTLRAGKQLVHHGRVMELLWLQNSGHNFQVWRVKPLFAEDEALNYDRLFLATDTVYKFHGARGW